MAAAVETVIAALARLAPVRPSGAGPAVRASDAGRSAPWVGAAAEGAYACAGIEPPLREVLRDPIVRALMRGDGVGPAEVRRVLRAARRRRPPA